MVWALVTLGLIYLVTEAAISAAVRVALAKTHPLVATLVYCAACSGFWLGWLTAPLLEPWWASPLAAMALGAIWTTWHGAPAWVNEEALRGEPEATSEQQDQEERDLPPTDSERGVSSHGE